MKRICSVLVIFLLWAVPAHATAFSYYKAFTVTSNTALLPASQSNFPVLISFTNASLKSVANSGHVQSSSGYDIRPYTTPAFSTALTYQLEKYDATTGQVIMWVKIPTLSTGLVIYLGYGNTSLTSDGSSASTWDSHYAGVFHMADATFTTAVNSASGGNAAGAGSAIPTTTTGKIGAGMETSHTGYLDATSAAYGTSSGALTYSVWAKATSFPAADGYIGVVSSYNNPGLGFNAFHLVVKTSGKLYGYATTGDFNMHVENDGAGLVTLSTGTWYHLVTTYDSTGGLTQYVNGVLDKNVAANGALRNSTPATYIGNTPDNTARTWDGELDEAHLSDVARSADWITTEYSSENDPTTFLTEGSELSTTVIVFDSTANAGYQTAQSTYSFNVNCQGLNRALYVGVSMLSVGGSSVTSITHNGVALTKINSVASVTGAVRAELWELVAPATGTQSVAVTLSTGLDSAAGAVCFDGVHQTSPHEGANTNTATNVGATDATVGITTVADNDWVIAIGATDDTAITAGQTSRWNTTGALGSGAGETFGPQTPAGLKTMNYTAVGALATWSVAGVAIRDLNAAALSSGGNYRLLFGVGK